MRGARESPPGQKAGGDDETSRLSTPSLHPPAGTVNAPTCPDCGCAARLTPTGAYVCDVCHSHVPTAPPKARGRDRRQRQDGSSPTPEAEPVAVVIKVADVNREEIDWEWEARLPGRRIVLIEGDPGVGKSWLALAIATAITTGAPFPGQTAPREPGKVLLLTAEDGIADTVRPRLEDMGADLSRVMVLQAMRDERGNERHLSLVGDLGAVEAVLGEGGYKLLIVDPLNAYLGFTLDTHRDAALRAALTPLALLAERWGVIVLCIRHLTKGGRDKAIYRGQGNIAFTAAARVVFLVGENPDDPRERVFACIKNNLAPLPPALAFELTDGQFLWRGITDVTAAALLRPDADEGERGALAEAEGFLRELLADGPMEVKQVGEERREAGIKERTLDRAKATLGVRSERQGGLASKGRWEWVLPKGANTPHTVLLAPLDRLDTKVDSPLGTLSTTKEITPTKDAKSVCVGDMAPLGEPIKERSPLVRLALDLGAKVVGQ